VPVLIATAGEKVPPAFKTGGRMVRPAIKHKAPTCLEICCVMD